MIKKVTVTSARGNLDNLIDHVRHRHDFILIPRRGEPVAAIVDIGQFNKIRALESEFDRLAGGLQKAFEGRTIEKVEKDIRKRTRRGDLLTRLGFISDLPSQSEDHPENRGLPRRGYCH